MKVRLSALALLCLAAASSAWGQGAGNMPGMENSAGTFSAGTSLEPRSTSESNAAIHQSLGNWTLMLHANAFVQDIQQSGPRGYDKFFSTNWIMPMLQHSKGRQSIGFRAMLSLEPLTVTDRRYPLLFQTGETAFGRPIVDGQHPHNFVMELTARYQFDFNARTQLFLYGGPVGDPALGPPAFPHRASASENPVAVLGHHEQDSTHISVAVATAGVVAGPVQVEASMFHGQEPNENRWAFGRGKPDSFSGRITVAPQRNLTGQFSIGRINGREPEEPGLDTIRTTASLHHHFILGSGHMATSLIWGRNKDMVGGDRRIFNAFTFESTANFKKQYWAWTRIENVDKDSKLFLGETEEAHHIEETPAGRVQAYSFGFEREVFSNPAISVGLGAQYTAYGLPQPLRAVYGDRPQSLVLFLRLRPTGNSADHMKMMHGH